LRLGGKRRRKAERQSRRGDKEMPGERSRYDRSDGCLHRGVLLFNAGQTAQSRLQGWNRKPRAKPKRRRKSLRRRADQARAASICRPGRAHLPSK
jgi:hypothetical protein